MADVNVTKDDLGLVDILLMKNGRVIKSIRLVKDEWEQLKRIVQEMS